MTPRTHRASPPLAALLLATACAVGPTPYTIEAPARFPAMVVPDDNPTTVEGVALGRVLYHDPRLSPDGSRACADCHLQEQSFSSTNAVGVLPHLNLGWAGAFLWDGSVEGTLEDAMVFEVVDFFRTDLVRLAEPDLEAMFLAAFGSEEPTVDHAAKALAQYQRTLVSAASSFDRYLDGDDAALSEAAVRGSELFYSERAECFHCHATMLFTDNRFHNIGLDAVVSGTGRGAFTGDPLHDGQFKTPTLRNVERTAPYMHDDRFATLEEVIDHYAEGLVHSDTIDPLMRDVDQGGFGWTAQERADLVAFLRSLTDEGFLTDPALGAP